MPEPLSELELIQDFLLQHGIHATQPAEPTASAAEAGAGRLRRAAAQRSGTLPRRRLPTATERNQALHAAAAQRARRAVARQWTRHRRWALEHPDWPEFLANAERSHREALESVVRHNNAFRHWLLSPAGQREVERIRRHREIYRLQHGAVRPRRRRQLSPRDSVVAVILLAATLLLVLAGRWLPALLPLLLAAALLSWRWRRP
jgi:hypothetical protein